MKAFSTVALLILTLASVNVGATDHPISKKRCEFTLSHILPAILEPSKNLLKDAELKTYDPYWGRLSQALHTVPKATLIALFTGPDQIIPADIDDTWWLVQIGEIKVDHDTQMFLNSLREFVIDNPQAFDGTDEAPYKIMQAVDRADELHSFKVGSGVVVETVDAALRKNEEVLLVQALRESKGQRNKSNKWYDWFLNYFSPLYKRMDALINFDEMLRHIMQIDALADEPVSDVLKRYSQKISPAGQTRLQDLITDTGEKLAYVREIFKKVFGRELSSREPIQIGDIRLRSLKKAIEEAKVTKKESTAVGEAEADLNVIDEVMKEIYPQKRPPADYIATHLQIRYGQYRRETGEMTSLYRQVGEKSPSQADYTVTARWTVEADFEETKYRTVDVYEDQDDGKGGTNRVKTGTTEESYTVPHHTSNPMSGTFTLFASYNEIMENQIQPSVSAVESQLPDASSNAESAAGVMISARNEGLRITGTDNNKTNWILSQAARARDMEAPLRKKINEAIALVDAVADSYPGNIKNDQSWEKTLGSLDQAMKEIESLYASQLSTYRALASAQVTSVWAQEKFENFKERNNLLAKRYLHLLYRTELFREQVNRKMKLPLQIVSPDYTRLMKELEKIAKSNRRQQKLSGLGLAIMVLGGGYVYDINHEHIVNHKIQELIHGN